MLPIIVTSVAPVVGEVMDSFLKNMPKPADIVNVEWSAVVQSLKRNVLLRRHENGLPEQYSRRETIQVVGVKEEEGGGIPRRKCWIFSRLLAQRSLRLMFELYIEWETGKRRGGRSWCGLFPGRRGKRLRKRRRD